MEGFVQSTPSERIRSFFIKDILEHKRSATALPKSSFRGPVDQGIHTDIPMKTYNVQHIMAASGHREEPDACITGCCEFSAVYPCKPITTKFYHQYLYSLYRQQTAWRHSLKDGVTYVEPPSVLYSQPKQRKPRRPWTRAVFSNLQRKGLEKRFQVQKYLTKGDRHQLASMLGLSDNQVKVWFQNRRMKWRQEEQAHEEPAPDKSSDFQTSTISSNNEATKPE